MQSVEFAEERAVVLYDPARFEGTAAVERALAAAGFRGGWDVTSETRTPGR